VAHRPARRLPAHLDGAEVELLERARQLALLIGADEALAVHQALRQLGHIQANTPAKVGLSADRGYERRMAPPTPLALGDCYVATVTAVGAGALAGSPGFRGDGTR